MPLLTAIGTGHRNLYIAWIQYRLFRRVIRPIVHVRCLPHHAKPWFHHEHDRDVRVHFCPWDHC